MELSPAAASKRIRSLDTGVRTLWRQRTCSNHGLTALRVLRMIEEEGIKQKANEIVVFVPSEVGFYILNKKREALATIEERYRFQVFLEADDSLVSPDMRIERIVPKPGSERMNLSAPIISPHVEESADDVGIEADTEVEPEDRDEERPLKRSRRRRRRGGDKRAAEQQDQGDTVSEEVQDAAQGGEDKAIAADGETASGEDDDGNKKRRRRGKRGGRRRSRRGNGEEGVSAAENGAENDEDTEQADRDVSDDKNSQAAPVSAPASLPHLRKLQASKPLPPLKRNRSANRASGAGRLLRRKQRQP